MNVSIKYFALFHVFYPLNNKRTHTSSVVSSSRYQTVAFCLWTVCQSTVYAVPSEKLEHLSPHFSYLTGWMSETLPS